MLLLACIWGCSGDFITSKEGDLKKYPELSPFVYKIIRFYGENTDLERDVFRFSYESHEPDVKPLLAMIHTNAISSGWDNILYNNLERGYSKNLRRYPAQTRDDLVFVKYDEKTRRVYVTWQ